MKRMRNKNRKQRRGVRKQIPMRKKELKELQM